MFKNILDKIIKIESREDSHIKLVLFNFIKFNLKKPRVMLRYYLEKRIFNYYKKHKIDISTYPKATGYLRDIQLAELELLKEFDYVCKKVNFDYWLDFGTLLGAVRHKGFIPWDDDVDVMMPREFYDKFIETFNKTTRNPHIHALYRRINNKAGHYFIRIKYKEFPIVLDVFPCDFYGAILTEEEGRALSKEIKKSRSELITRDAHKTGLSNEEISKRISEFKDKVLVNGYHTKESKTDIVWGVDFHHMWKQWFHHYETIYPLKQIEFEGVNFNCPNDCEAYLTSIYDNYMQYPNNVKHKHSAFRLTNKELRELKKYINKRQK